jgi:hypothetical protein
MQKVNGKTIASLKQEFNGFPAGTLLLVEKCNSGFYRAWHSFYKNIGSDIGLVPASILQ